VVFIHGFNGHPKDTWTSNGFFWPWEFRNTVPDVRIMTFGYNADIETSLTRNLMGIHDYAANLLVAVRNERVSHSVSLI
jgi:hypothetical protein